MHRSAVQSDHGGADDHGDTRPGGGRFCRGADSVAALPVGHVTGYDFLDEGEPGAAEGGGYYRRADAAPPDEWEYSRIVLQRASAAGADFVACPEPIMQLAGYDFKEVRPLHSPKGPPPLPCARQPHTLAVLRSDLSVPA